MNERDSAEFSGVSFFGKIEGINFEPFFNILQECPLSFLLKYLTILIFNDSMQIDKAKIKVIRNELLQNQK